MLTTIILTGYMARFVKEPILIESTNARDALEKLQNYLPKGVRHYIKINEVACLDDLDEPKATLTLSPMLGGAGGSNKRAGGIQILLGVLLIAFAVFAPQLGLTLGKGLLASKGTFILLGAQLVLGGALQLLQKSPKADPTQGDKQSRFINSGGNTIKEGTPIPLIYGRQKVYGHIISFNIDAEPYAP